MTFQNPERTLVGLDYELLIGTSPTLPPTTSSVEQSGFEPESRSLQQGSDKEFADCTAILTSYVQNSVQDEVRSMVPEVESLAVSLENVAFDTLLDAPESLVFFFDVVVKIRSPNDQLDDMNQYVESAFDTAEKEQAFLEYLRGSNCSEFKSAVSVQLILPPEPEPLKKADRANTGLIVGIVVAVIAAVMLVALVVFVKLRGGRRAFLYDENKPLSHRFDDANDYASEIGLRTNVEVSTLSDPIPMGVQQTAGETSTIGSFSLDYDYQKAYQGSVSEMSGSGPSSAVSNVMVPTDDDTLEAQYVIDEEFEVVAPSGVLGLILETNEDGVPVVNSIKDSSVLFGLVHVGDRLMSVDGLDVTVMLASDVSKLIAAKKHQKERIFVFARSVKGSRAALGDGGAGTGSGDNNPFS